MTTVINSSLKMNLIVKLIRGEEAAKRLFTINPNHKFIMAFDMLHIKKNNKAERHWIIEDHLCRDCGGRILKCAKNTGMSPGGNPLYKCANCGKSTWGISANCLCWCGMAHRNQSMNAYICLPFSIIEEKPEVKEMFLRCGCDPARGEVGIVLMREFKEEVNNE